MLQKFVVKPKTTIYFRDDMEEDGQEDNTTSSTQGSVDSSYSGHTYKLKRRSRGIRKNKQPKEGDKSGDVPKQRRRRNNGVKSEPQPR